MKIGIMGAMEQETSLLCRKIEHPVHEMYGMRKYTSGQLFGRDVVAVFSRCGKVAAASTATTLIEYYGVDLIIFTGVAGAANTALNIGDVVVATETVQHDMDASALPDIARFEIPLLEATRFPVDEQLVDLAMKSASSFLQKQFQSTVTEERRLQFGIETPAVCQGLIASGDQFIADSDKIAALARELKGLECVEMEGAAVAQVCHEHQKPMVLLRVISDSANQEAITDFPAFIDGFASQMTCGIVEELIQQV